MNIRIDHAVDICGGKAYPLTITRITGFQIIYVRGEAVPVEAVTYCDYGGYCTQDITRARPPASPEERAARERLIQETAVRGLVEQGIW